LISGSSPIAERVGLHRSSMKDGIMRMRPVKAIEVFPGEPTAIAPGGLHIMLIGLKQPLVAGRTFPLTLTFERAGSVEVQVKVQEDNAGSMKH
jgi:copper(I)-binding protein